MNDERFHLMIAQLTHVDLAQEPFVLLVTDDEGVLMVGTNLPKEIATKMVDAGVSVMTDKDVVSKHPVVH